MIQVTQKTPDSGFTLLELLVVLAIIGLVSGLAAVVMPQRLSGAQAARVEGELVAWLRDQAQQASRDNQIIAVRAAAGGLRSDQAHWQAPRHSTLEISSAPLVFYPDGSASSNDIIVRSGDSDIRATIHGLTGQVEAIR